MTTLAMPARPPSGVSPKATSEPARAPSFGAGAAPTIRTSRFVTEGRYGTIIVDVIGDALFVNGDPVEPFEPAAAAKG